MKIYITESEAIQKHNHMVEQIMEAKVLIQKLQPQAQSLRAAINGTPQKLKEAKNTETAEEYRAASREASKLLTWPWEKVYLAIKSGKVSERVFWLFCSDLSTVRHGVTDKPQDRISPWG